MPRVRRGLTTTARAAIAAAAATACVAATTAHGLAFSETFDDGTLGGWTASADAKYEGAHDWMAMAFRHASIGWIDPTEKSLERDA